jgi:hypothetical protein
VRKEIVNRSCWTIGNLGGVCGEGLRILVEFSCGFGRDLSSRSLKSLDAILKVKRPISHLLEILDVEF